MNISKIVSGGQTGADRAALDAAIACGVAHGGWCPEGRRAEDGPIPPLYRLRETQTDQYAERTRLNVLDSDATLIISRGPLTGGSLLTLQCAEAAGKPCVHIDLNRFFQPLETADAAGSENFQTSEAAAEAARRIFQTLEKTVPNPGNIVLNVAGPRASGDPLIGRAVFQVIEQMLSAR